ncbi:MAG: mannose-1-phosphate guanylyltransferase [Bacilli bacterium]|nr:mannose-1-phosphate guanylyltransferase [Bacilli bacterium]MDY6430366.1 mannose-1-phosphate guanylyltransferase [Bacilli bacterium]
MSEVAYLIMCGGKGERFWPLSTEEKPKQYLSIFSDKPLLTKAVERVLPLTDIDHIFIATNKSQKQLVKEVCPNIKDSNIILEPLFKDTAAAIGFGSSLIAQRFDNPIICVLASDQLINDEENFRKTLQIAVKSAGNDEIVTLGIFPTSPRTEYGYIKVSSPKVNEETKCLAFKEKPQLEVAKQYFESKEYLWNSGMFIFKYSVLMNAFEKYSPIHHEVFSELCESVSLENLSENEYTCRLFFEKLPKISIDYAVMEKAENVYVIPSSFDWDDVGSFEAFFKLFEKDVDNNVNLNSLFFKVDSNNNIVVSSEKDVEIGLIGIKNSIIACNKGKILVCDRTKSALIKELLEERNKVVK